MRRGETELFSPEELKIYALISRRNGIKARAISRETGIDKTEVSRRLVSSALMRELCYQDSDYRWHALMKQQAPYEGLYEFSGWYGTVREFTAENEETWLKELSEGCTRIGRNLNDTRGLIHSFRDCRETMLSLFTDLKDMGVATEKWEITFELRFNLRRYIRIYADVLVITQNRVFPLEFKIEDSAHILNPTGKDKDGGKDIEVPVKTDESLIDGSNSFYFIRTVNWSEYKPLAAAYEAGDDKTGLVAAVQLPVAILAVSRYSKNNLVSHEDSGSKVKTDENEKIPFEWMVDRDERAQRERYYRAMDALYAFLEGSGMKEWAESEEKKRLSTSVVRTIHDFERIYPVGRLDKESEGLILLTNDGSLVNRIMKASSGHEKEYQFRVILLGEL